MKDEVFLNRKTAINEINDFVKKIRKNKDEYMLYDAYIEFYSLLEGLLNKYDFKEDSRYITCKETNNKKFFKNLSNQQNLLMNLYGLIKYIKGKRKIIECLPTKKITKERKKLNHEYYRNGYICKEEMDDWMNQAKNMKKYVIRKKEEDYSRNEKIRISNSYGIKLDEIVDVDQSEIFNNIASNWTKGNGKMREFDPEYITYLIKNYLSQQFNIEVDVQNVSTDPRTYARYCYGKITEENIANLLKIYPKLEIYPDRIQIIINEIKDVILRPIYISIYKVENEKEKLELIEKHRQDYNQHLEYIKDNKIIF